MDKKGRGITLALNRPMALRSYSVYRALLKLPKGSRNCEEHSTGKWLHYIAGGIIVFIGMVLHLVYSCLVLREFNKNYYELSQRLNNEVFDSDAIFYFPNTMTIPMSPQKASLGCFPSHP